MSFTVTDRTKESSSTTGTGAFTLSGAASNYVTFNTAVGVNNFCWYCINHLSANEWEVGFGQLTGATTLTRVSVTAGTNGTSFVNFSAGTKEVFVTQPSAFNAQTLGRTNMVINPHGSVQQETTTPVTVTSGIYFADQWLAAKTSSTGVLQAGVTTGTVSSYDPSYMFMKTTTAQGSLAAGDFFVILQPIEGLYTRRLLYGTSAAKTSWLRFRASCTQSATCSFSLRNGTNDRSFVQSFAVTTTPTDYFFLIPGDTTGTWATGNTQGVNLTFAHSCGTSAQTSTLGAWQAGNFTAANTQTNLMATLNAQLNITDVQFSDSRVLLPFEPIDFNDELLKCQRYFVALATAAVNTAFGTGQAFATTDAWVPIPLLTTMRVAPSVSFSAAGDFRLLSSSGTSITTTSVGTVATTPNMLNTSAGVAGGLTGGNAVTLHAGSTNARILASARF